MPEVEETIPAAPPVPLEVQVRILTAIAGLVSAGETVLNAVACFRKKYLDLTSTIAASPSFSVLKLLLVIERLGALPAADAVKALLRTALENEAMNAAICLIDTEEKHAK